MIKLPPYTHAQQGRSKLLLKPLSKLSALLKQWLQVSKSACVCVCDVHRCGVARHGKLVSGRLTPQQLCARQPAQIQRQVEEVLTLLCNSLACC